MKFASMGNSVNENKNCHSVFSTEAREAGSLKPLSASATLSDHHRINQHAVDIDCLDLPANFPSGLGPGDYQT
jgi:hypothetical protein